MQLIKESQIWTGPDKNVKKASQKKQPKYTPKKKEQ